MIPKAKYLMRSGWSWIIPMLLLCPSMHGQEIRTGLEYSYKTWKGPELTMGLEFREQSAFPVPPGVVLLEGKARYKLTSRWKAGLSFRGSYEQKDSDGEEKFMNDHYRTTLDNYISWKTRKQENKVQLRIRCQRSWDTGKADHYGRLRIKWEQRSFHTFRPYSSLEIIYAGVHAVPDASRVRIGMKTRMSPWALMDAYYQAEIRLQNDYEIMQFALGVSLKFESR